MKTRFAAAAGALFLAATVSPLAGQFLQPTPGREPAPGVTPIGTQKLHDPNAEQEAQQIPTPGGLPDRRPRPPAARPSQADGASMDAILAALYASVSHDSAGEPNWERMREIFLPVGMLIPPKNPRSDMFTVLDVDSFEQRVHEGMAAAKAKGEPTAFFEKEIARKYDCFGAVCQIFSTYESRHAPADEKPFIRGINSIQIVNDGHRWWIASVVWDTERTDNPIPAQYMPTAPVIVPSEYLKKN